MELDFNGREQYTEKRVETDWSVLTLRQVGWLGHSKIVYPLGNAPSENEAGGFMPLWIIAHADDKD